MTLLLGLVLGTGVLLAVSPLLWPATRSRADRASLGYRARERLTQAGLERVGAPTVVVVSGILGVAVAALMYGIIPVMAVAAAAGISMALLPWTVVLWRARLHRRATRVVWPDVVDHLVSAVRSGLALPDSVVSLAASGPPITRAAFADFDRDYRMTGGFADSLDRLKDRLADPVADRIIETLRMSREVGGNELTTVLRNLAAYLRQDAAIRSEVEARQSWVVNAARLGVAAPWIVLLLLSTRPEAAAAYNTAEGSAVILVGLALSVVAYRIMIGIGRLPEERRWFG
ncbi:MAG TPA: type II secretion system F family protein [Galbitalea sp.]|jgi:tight adherence protein B|nr:type II secretion system F family protein [Galbitalea sp.]